MSLRFNAAAVQTCLPNPTNRAEMKRNTARIVQLIEMAVEGYKPFLPLRLIVFPEFAHAAPVFPTRRELHSKLGVPIPNRHTERVQEKARELNLYVQMGTMLEIDDKYPGALFNTTCLVGPSGILYKYRKIYPWIPWEVHTSPHDIPDYEEEMYPVAETPIGRIGAAICYDWLFPEVLRQLVANGAEILARVSAYMDPFGATEPMDWWTVVNRCRALENLAFVVASNQGATLKHYPPFSWPGGSMLVDYDGRILTQATPGDGEKIVIGPLDVELLRLERETRLAHQMPAHLRAEAHSRFYGRPAYPAGSLRDRRNWTYDDNVQLIEKARRRTGHKRTASGDGPGNGEQT